MWSKIKYFFQRGLRGYADCDLWAIDYWLATVMVKALAQFNCERYGYPHDMGDEEWGKIINTMREGFEATLKLDDTYDDKEYKKVKAIQDKGLALFAKYFNYLWD